jgi:hypothetical protein
MPMGTTPCWIAGSPRSGHEVLEVRWPYGGLCVDTGTRPGSGSRPHVSRRLAERGDEMAAPIPRSRASPSARVVAPAQPTSLGRHLGDGGLELVQRATMREAGDRDRTGMPAPGAAGGR